MSYNSGTELIESFGNLFKAETNYDVIIYVGEEPNVKEFRAHSCILRCRSEHFNNIISDENIEKKDGKYVVRHLDISPQDFDDILWYIYTSEFDISKKSGTEVLNLLITSIKLNLEKLIEFIKDFIIKNYDQFLKVDPIGVLQITCNNNKLLPELEKKFLEKVCNEPEILSKNDKFIELPSNLLEIILKRNDLILEEIEIWNSLIKWGLAQNGSPKQDISKWGQNEFSTFKILIENFIPLIKFFGISSKDYYNKIKPFEEILSKELKDDIMKYYMIPEYIPNYTPRCFIPYVMDCDYKSEIEKVQGKGFPYENNKNNNKNDKYVNFLKTEIPKVKIQFHDIEHKVALLIATDRWLNSTNNLKELD